MRTGPDYIQLYPTLRCNRSCGFCFNRSLSEAEDMSHDSFAALLPILKKASVKTIDIIGGEPTLHPDIVTFVREAANSGFFINVSSNGSNPRALEELVDIGRKVTVGISINDYETLEQVREFVKTHKVVVKSIFQPDMDSKLVQSILVLEPKKYFLIYRDATDRQDLGNTMPFFKFVAAAKQRYGPGRIGLVYCSGFLPDLKNYPELAHTRCPAGTTKLGVLPDGSAYPCNLFFGRHEYLLGNVLTEPFERIWNHRLLTFFRKYYKNACPRASCELHAQCHGGCPAQAYLLTGDLAAADPRCRAL